MRNRTVLLLALWLVACEEAPAEMAQPSPGGPPELQETDVELRVQEVRKYRDHYGIFSPPPVLHLQLRREPQGWRGELTPAPGEVHTLQGDFQPDRALSEPPSYGEAKVSGPLLLTREVARGESGYSQIALSMDGAGKITGGYVAFNDYWRGVRCTQTYSGAVYVLSVQAEPDVTPPLLAPRRSFPWALGLSLSEPLKPMPAPLEQPLGMVGSEQTAALWVPRFEDPFSLGGRTLSFTFPAIEDQSGHVSTNAQASIEVVDLGPRAPSFSFATEGEECSGEPFTFDDQGPPARSRHLLSRPGATRARIGICSPYSSYPPQELKVAAWSKTGERLESAFDLAKTEKVQFFEAAMPADDSAIELTLGECMFQARLVSLEAL